ncbi:hypothetical protein, partial [Ruminococcus sp.]|uniref:hypothetical protein n=1 Tax=Ruminococcus sp. TaxID=41978 RepID=UPI00258CC585
MKEKVIQLGTGGVETGDLFNWGTVYQRVDDDGKTIGYFGIPVYRILDKDRDNSGNTPEQGRTGYMFVISDGTWGYSYGMVNWTTNEIAYRHNPDAPYLYGDEEGRGFAVDHWSVIQINGYKAVWSNSLAKCYYDNFGIDTESGESINFSKAENACVPKIEKNTGGGDYQVTFYPEVKYDYGIAGNQSASHIMWDEDKLSAYIFPISMNELQDYFGGTVSDAANSRYVAHNYAGMSSAKWSLRSYLSQYYTHAPST